MSGAYWFLVYMPLGLGAGTAPTAILGAGYDVLGASVAGYQRQAGSVAGVQYMGAVK